MGPSLKLIYSEVRLLDFLSKVTQTDYRIRSSNGPKEVQALNSEHPSLRVSIIIFVVRKYRMEVPQHTFIELSVSNLINLGTCTILWEGNLSSVQ